MGFTYIHEIESRGVKTINKKQKKRNRFLWSGEGGGGEGIKCKNSIENKVEEII